MEGRHAGPAGPTGLRGRAAECALLDGLIDGVRRGESRSLVLRGEAGIGKTALLEYLVASASDLTVVRAVGVESEMELAYASLHQLCAPMLDQLSTASGSAAAGAGDRVRAQLGRGPGPVSRRAGGAQPALRNGRAASAAVRAWMTRSGWIRRRR